MGEVRRIEADPLVKHASHIVHIVRGALKSMENGGDAFEQFPWALHDDTRGAIIPWISKPEDRLERSYDTESSSTAAIAGEGQVAPRRRAGRRVSMK